MLATAFEVGPYRPPSEAYSLLIRATRNCSWNRCRFCLMYKGQKLELRDGVTTPMELELCVYLVDTWRAYLEENFFDLCFIGSVGFDDQLTGSSFTVFCSLRSVLVLVFQLAYTNNL